MKEPVGSPGPVDLLGVERQDLAQFLRSLDPDDWARRTACGDWTIRDVALHATSYDDLSVPTALAAFARARLSVDRMNQERLDQLAGWTPEQVIDRCDRPVRPPRALALVVFGDTLIHHQDIRRAVGRPRLVPPTRLTTALRYALTSPSIRGSRHLRGLRTVADDLSWTYGDDGPGLYGPGEALLMAMSGRTAALGELRGPGRHSLADRLTRR